MKQLLLLSGLAMGVAAPAQAIEMFTNFHNGENIGFPPMQVPAAIYGHGGWNNSALHTIPIRDFEPVPAMSPTGCDPHAVNCWRCGPVSAGYENYYAGDRWHGRAQRGIYRSNIGAAPAETAGGDGDKRATSKMPADSDSAPAAHSNFRENVPATSEPSPQPVWLNAQPGVAPETQSKNNVSPINSELDTSTARVSKPMGRSSARRDTANWSRDDVNAADNG